jgi:cytidylate kinase
VSVPVVAIDGPSGSGKGTVSKAVAEALGFGFLDSGAIYRVVGLAALRRGVDMDDAAALAALARDVRIRFDFQVEGPGSIVLDGEAVGETIRTEAVASAASRVAAHPEVRAALLELQRTFRQPPGLVADGRDMGTVVFPDAPCKVFLDASAEERARRRHRQLKEMGSDVTFPLLLSEIRERDRRDRDRQTAPLVPAPDATTLDTTHLGIDEVIEKVLDFVQKRL